MNHRATFLITLLCCFSLSAQGQVLNKLGQRPSHCSAEQVDDFELNLSATLTQEARNLFEKDKLTQVLTEMPHCFRVGTEIKIFLDKQEIGYLGRAFVSQMETLTPAKLQSKNTIYTNSAIKDYSKKTSAKKVSLLKIKMSEKIQESFVEEQWGRLSSCFPSYSDWESYRITPEEGMKEVKAIQTGKKTAHIWNGTFNCYKVGRYARLRIQDTTHEDFGSILPKGLYLVHHTNLTQKHANLLGENLSSLKKRMALKKEVDGGYTTMVVFEYAEPLPPEEETESLLPQ